MFVMDFLQTKYFQDYIRIHYKIKMKQILFDDDN